jgi:nicotinamidase-related amidase
MKEALTRDVAFVRDETALLFVDLQRQFLVPGLEPIHPEMGADNHFNRRIQEIVLQTPFV